MGKSSPAAPDPVQTANAQGVANENAARVQTKLNNPSSYGPGGSVKRYWNGDDTSDVYTTLSDGQQRIYNNQERLTGDTSQAAVDATARMSDFLKTGLSTEGMQNWNAGPSGAPQLQTGIAGAGQGIQTGIAGAGQGIQTGIPGAGVGVRGAIGGAGQGIQDSITGAGQGIRDTIGGAGQGIRSDFSTGQALARQGTQDYGAQRDSVEQAIMSRVQPQYAQDRTAMDAKLAAQGFTQGTAGYQQNADELNRSLTDARMQAVLAGGQEQSRLFGLDQSRLGFNNNASQAETAQHNAGLQDINAAQQQGFGQQAQEAAFGNTAQGQRFAQNAADAAFGNSAQGQRFGQTAEEAAFGNTAQGQVFGQQAQNATFGNAAQQQGFGQNAQEAQFANDAQGQAFGQRAQDAAFGNTAAGQQFNSGLALSASQNQTRQAQLAERLQLRAQPINETASLFGLGSGVTMPTPAQASPVQVAAPDYQGLVSNNYKAASSASAANNAATTGAAVAVASAAAVAI